MPKKDDAPAVTVCDGCGMENADLVSDDIASVFAVNLCDACFERRLDDPPITYQGRTMPLSEFERQAEDDEHLAIAMQGDTVQEQIKRMRALLKEHKAARKR